MTPIQQRVVNVMQTLDEYVATPEIESLTDEHMLTRIVQEGLVPLMPNTRFPDEVRTLWVELRRTSRLPSSEERDRQVRRLAEEFLGWLAQTFMQNVNFAVVPGMNAVVLCRELYVNLGPPEVTAILQYLYDHRNRRVMLKEMQTAVLKGRHVDEKTIRDWLKALPEPIRSCVKSRRNSGYYLELPAC